MTEKGTPSYLTKELLASTVLQVNAKAQWEVAGHSGQSQGFAQNTGAARHPSSHRSRVHHLPHLSTRTCSCPLPLMCTDRQTGRQTGSATAPQASEGSQSSSGSRRQQLGQRCGPSLKAQPYSGCLGPKQQPRGSSAIGGS